MKNTPPPAIGVGLGGTKIEAIVLDATGASLWRERVPTPAGDYAATLAAVAALVEAKPSESPHLPRRGHFYFAQRGHYDLALTRH